MNLLVDTLPSSTAAGSGGRGFPYHHARRNFFDLTTSGKAPIAEEAQSRIGELYHIEKAIRGEQPDMREAARQHSSTPKVEALRFLLDEHSNACRKNQGRLKRSDTHFPAGNHFAASLKTAPSRSTIMRPNGPSGRLRSAARAGCLRDQKKAANARRCNPVTDRNRKAQRP